MSVLRVTRRKMLKFAGLGVGLFVAACKPQTVEVEKVVDRAVVQTVEVEKIVEKEVTKIVEKVVQAPPEKITLRYGTHSFGEQLPGFIKMVEIFNDSQDKLYAAVEAKPWGEYWQALETQSVAGIAPDVVWSGRRAHVHFIEGKKLVDVSDFIERDGIDLNDWFGGEGGFTWKGKHYGMPFGNGGIIFYYNKDLFDAEGLDYPNEDWDWNDWRDAAQALTKDANGDGVIDQFGMDISRGGESGWEPLTLSNGGRWVNGMQFTNGTGWWELPAEPIKYFFNEEMLKALEWWQENICDLGLQPKSGEVTLAPGVGDTFAGGIVATQPQGTWRYNRYKAVTAFEWDVAPIPKSPITGKRMCTYNLMPNWVMSSTKHPEESYELAKWFAMEDAQQILGSMKIKIPCLKSAADSYLNPPPGNVKIIPELVNYGWSLVTEAYPGLPEVYAAWQAEYDYAYLCEKSMEEALQSATDAANAVLATL